MNKAIRIIFLVMPFAAIPLLSSLNFGGGEKDIFLVIIWGFWSILFFFSGLSLWKENRAFFSWFFKSIINSVFILIVMFCLLISGLYLKSLF